MHKGEGGGEEQGSAWRVVEVSAAAPPTGRSLQSQSFAPPGCADGVKLLQSELCYKDRAKISILHLLILLLLQQVIYSTDTVLLSV